MTCSLNWTDVFWIVIALCNFECLIIVFVSFYTLPQFRKRTRWRLNFPCFFKQIFRERQTRHISHFRYIYIYIYRERNPKFHFASTTGILVDSTRRPSGSRDIEWRGTEYWISRGSGRQSETAAWFAAGSPRFPSIRPSIAPLFRNVSRAKRETFESYESSRVRFSVWNSFNPVYVDILRALLSSISFERSRYSSFSTLRGPLRSICRDRERERERESESYTLDLNFETIIPSSFCQVTSNTCRHLM